MANNDTKNKKNTGNLSGILVVLGAILLMISTFMKPIEEFGGWEWTKVVIFSIMIIGGIARLFMNNKKA